MSATPSSLSSRPVGDPVGEVAPAIMPDLHTDLLLRAAAAAGTDAERKRLLNEVVIRTMPVAEAIAARYRARGESQEDLVQVAALALVKATRRYEPERGTHFLAYAVPTISGELRRYFRDHGWDVRPPRRLQELRISVREASSQLSQELGREPTLREISVRTGAEGREIQEMLLAADSYSTQSLDAEPGSELSLEARLGDDDTALEDVVDRVALRPLLAALPERDRRIITLRFYGGWTQQRIAASIGVTQMQVSRLIERSLSRLRNAALDEAG
jgi:RNA polymerase sigma-B factor